MPGDRILAEFAGELNKGFDKGIPGYSYLNAQIGREQWSPKLVSISS